MADLNTSKYQIGPNIEAGNFANVRMIDFVVNLAADVTMTTATDSAAVCLIPAGTLVLAAGIEQITAGTAGNTLVARVGTVVMSATLASDATAGTITANADVAGGTPKIQIAAATLNVLSATAARVTGVIRVFAFVIEATAPTYPIVSARDTSL